MKKTLLIVAPLALVVPLAILVAARTNTGHTPREVEIRLLESAAPACSDAGLARDLQARVLRKGETVACGDFGENGSCVLPLPAGLVDFDVEVSGQELVPSTGEADRPPRTFSGRASSKAISGGVLVIQLDCTRADVVISLKATNAESEAVRGLPLSIFPSPSGVADDWRPMTDDSGQVVCKWLIDGRSYEVDSEPDHLKRLLGVRVRFDASRLNKRLEFKVPSGRLVRGVLRDGLGRPVQFATVENVDFEAQAGVRETQVVLSGESGVFELLLDPSRTDVRLMVIDEPAGGEKEKVVSAEYVEDVKGLAAVKFNVTLQR